MLYNLPLQIYKIESALKYKIAPLSTPIWLEKFYFEKKTLMFQIDKNDFHSVDLEILKL